MAKDHSLPLRRALVTALRADAPIMAVVDDRAYGEKTPSQPTWPFVKAGVIIAAPFDATCLSGMEATFNIYAFAIGKDGGAAYNLGLLVQQALDGAKLTLEGNAHTVSLDWQGSELFSDPHEADGYFSAVGFRAVTSDDY